MRERVVALATMKGGSGKSTVATCIAGYWWAKKRKTALIDADPQKSAARWLETGEALSGLRCEVANEKSISSKIEALLEEGYERIVIDTPGFRASVTDIALEHAGLCLIPVRPSPVDFEVAADKVDLIDKLRKAGAEGPVALRLLLTQVVRNSVVGRHMRNEMSHAGYKLMKSEICHRVGYTEAALMGSVPTLSQPRGAAALEIAALAQEADKILARS
ncbi:ParA family protein [Nisaea nitritireducens]|uniref:ParA family protein n=1 Tax=Nisaea nitritireducens TaxID=568392 RepID=UPI00186668A2|nr:ParA family protein [Nisaea nitritireducens]